MEEKPRQNITLELDISDHGMNGEGVAKYGDYTVFVKGALKGEKVRAKVTFVRKFTAYAETVETLTPSPHRVKPPCNRFGRCGGCDLLHVDYAEQLKIKKDALERTLRKSVSLDCDVEDVVPSPPFGYRNKLQLPFGTVENGRRTVLGFYMEGTHKVVPIGKCFLNGDYSEKLIKAALSWAIEGGISVYDERLGKGFLRHLVARKSGEHLDVTVVGNGTKLPQAAELYKKLSEEFPSCALWFSENRKPTNVIMGDSVRLLFGENKPCDFMGVKYCPNPLSFVQVNPYIAQKLYDRIVETVAPDENCTVVDAYSGIGVLGAVMRKFGANVANIEIIKEAVSDGVKMYSENGLAGDGVSFTEGDAAAELPKILSSISKDRRVEIILDPPRKGCSESVTATLNAEAKKRPFGLIYVSCNPATLSRDLARLTEFRAETLIPFDMFAETKNLETFVRLKTK